MPRGQAGDVGAAEASPRRAHQCSNRRGQCEDPDAIGYCGDCSFDVYNDDHPQMPPDAVAARVLRVAEWLGETVLQRAPPVRSMERLR